MANPRFDEIGKDVPTPTKESDTSDSEARAAAARRRAGLTAGKGTGVKKAKTKTVVTPGTKVSQATIDKIKAMGMKKALAGAGGASAEMREGLKRLYGAKRVGAAAPAKPQSARPQLGGSSKSPTAKPQLGGAVKPVMPGKGPAATKSTPKTTTYTRSGGSVTYPTPAAKPAPTAKPAPRYAQSRTTGQAVPIPTPVKKTPTVKKSTPTPKYNPLTRKKI